MKTSGFHNGNIVEGLYRIEETFGGGGMGLVHRARHLGWFIDVAIKHPRSNFLMLQNQIAEFQRECATWSAIGLHPFVATCYYSREIGGLPCVVAEYLPGGSLQEAIQRKEIYRGDDDESLGRMLTIAASTAWGLSRAHEARLIHCDVKPGNMLLTEFGTAKIADFGLAIGMIGPDGSSKQNWMTKAFAAPEQLRCESLTPAVDVWGWAASMLAMFTGGLSWESGAACGAVLTEFMESGGQVYRIPSMPEVFAALLRECFQFNADARISDFGEIAGRICHCYEELFGEPCPASKPDLELISADSLNNRAVSRFDLGDLPEVHRLLDDALSVDPLHPEANFNSALLGYAASGKYSTAYLEGLKQGAQFDLGEYRPHLYLACLLNADGRSREASDCYSKARGIAAPYDTSEIQRLWNLSNQRKLTPVLAPPISGEDFAQDSARFGRLMAKAELAIREQRLDDARRYLLMSGDIPGFARHPRRRRALPETNL